MSPTREGPVEVVGESSNGMVEAMRRALLGATQRLGTLDCCEAEILSQTVRRDTQRCYQITLSVTRRQSQRGA